MKGGRPSWWHTLKTRIAIESEKVERTKGNKDVKMISTVGQGEEIGTRQAKDN